MNIDRVGQRAIEAYVQKAPGTVDRGEQAGTREIRKSEQDEVSISKEARELQQAKKVVLQAPDVREDKVAAIRKQIEAGTFQISTEVLVDKLLPVVSDD